MNLIENILPIFILLLIGYFLRKKSILNDHSVEGLKTLVIKLGLPAVLFKTFLNMELKKEYIAIVITIIFLCIAAFILGSLIAKVTSFNSVLTPFLVSGFAFGLLGISLFETTFGAEHLDTFSILGIGNEFFLWFIYITIMKFKYTGEKFSLGTIKSFIRSPLIIAVVTGLLLNILDLSSLFVDVSILKGIYAAINYISLTPTPLILMIIGYGMVINKKYIRISLKYVFLRYVILFSIGYLLKYTLLNLWINDIYFEYAFFTLLILPTPFSFPVFISEYTTKDEVELANNIIVMNICVCFLMFVLFTLFITFI